MTDPESSLIWSGYVSDPWPLENPRCKRVAQSLPYGIEGNMRKEARTRGSLGWDVITYINMDSCTYIIHRNSRRRDGREWVMKKENGRASSYGYSERHGMMNWRMGGLMVAIFNHARFAWFCPGYTVWFKASRAELWAKRILQLAHHTSPLPPARASISYHMLCVNSAAEEVGCYYSLLRGKEKRRDNN